MSSRRKSKKSEIQRDSDWTPSPGKKLELFPKSITKEKETGPLFLKVEKCVKNGSENLV